MLEIAKKARFLKQKFHTNNPFDLCDEMGIYVRFAELGSIKGFYKYYKRNRFVVINKCLDSYMQKLVCAHELGHDVLHREMAKSINLWENTLVDMSSRPELEANIFASEILIDDEMVLNELKNGVSIYELSHMYGIDENLIILKLNILKELGYKVNTNFSVQSDFLGKV